MNWLQVLILHEEYFNIFYDYFVLLLSGDVELNPGPVTGKRTFSQSHTH